jgi:hypothetical protein
MRLAFLLAVLLSAPAVASALAPAPVDARALAAERATQLLTQGPHLGKTPAGWLSFARAALAPAATPAPPVTLSSAMAQLYQAVGVQPDAAQERDLSLRIAALPGDAAAAFAPLVAASAQAYATQAALARGLDWGAMRLLPERQAEASVANAERVLGAVGAFEQAARGLRADVPGFEDPLGLVQLGGTGSDTFRPDSPFGDPVLTADLGGDDTYLEAAGGACPLSMQNPWATCNGLAFALAVDLAGNDRYEAQGLGVTAQGSGAFGGLGMLVDAQGDDVYHVQQGVPTDGFLLPYISGVVMGSGEAGVGMLLDAMGSDQYLFDAGSSGFDLYVQGQGFGGLGGVGVLADGAGNDLYSTQVRCDGPHNQLCGLYTMAQGSYSGAGIMVDVSGDDRYLASVVAPWEDYYAQSFAAFGALTLQADLAGNDVYEASATSYDTSRSALNCAYGTAEYAGALAIFLDAAGNDRYYDATYSPNGVSTMAEGFSLASTSLFWDAAGDDTHTMVSVQTDGGNNAVVTGRGMGTDVLDTFALYLDTGGQDTYADVPAAQTIGGNDQVWFPSVHDVSGLGVDEDVVPVLPV